MLIKAKLLETRVVRCPSGRLPVKLSHLVPTNKFSQAIALNPPPATSKFLPDSIRKGTPTSLLGPQVDR